MFLIVVYKHIEGTKLLKYNLSYNTRDLIKSLAQKASDRKHNKISVASFSFHLINELIIDRKLIINLFPNRLVPMWNYISENVQWAKQGRPNSVWGEGVLEKFLNFYGSFSTIIFNATTLISYCSKKAGGEGQTI